MKQKDFEDLSLLDRAVIEQRLRDAESRLEVLWDHHSLGIVELDENMRYVKVSPAFERMMGYSAAELSKMHVFEVTEADDLEVTQDAVVQTKSISPDLDHFTKRNIRKDGTPVTVRIKSRRLKSGPQSKTAYFSIIEDVTKETENQKKILETTAIMTAIFSNSEALVYVKDTQGRYMMVSSATEKFLARSSSYLIGKTDVEVLPLTIAEKIREADERILATKSAERVEEIAPGPNGLHYFHSLKFPIFNQQDEVIGLCGISYDVTELHRREAEIKQGRQFLDGLMNNSPAVIFAKDLKGRYTHVNDAFAKIVRQPKDKVLGKTLGQLFPGRESMEVLETEQLVVSTKKSITREEVRQTPDGVSIHAVTRFPLIDAEGKVYGVCGMATDITEFRRLIVDPSFRTAC